MARKSKSGAARAAGGAAEEAGAATPLARARLLFEAGNVRRARALLAEAASAGPEDERAEARAFFERTAPDRGAMLAAAGALLLIAFAAWTAILRAR